MNRDFDGMMDDVDSIGNGETEKGMEEAGEKGGGEKGESVDDTVEVESIFE